MKVYKLTEKLGDRRDEYFSTGHIKNAIAIQDIIVELADHLLITRDHEMGADWCIDD